MIATCRNPAIIASEPFYKKLELAVDDDESIARMAAQIIEPIDLLVNNAGILTREQDRLQDLDRAIMLREFNIDAVSPLMVAKALEGNLLKAHGSIINISSLLGSIADAEAVKLYGYRAAKAALNMVTKILSLEMKDKLSFVVAFHPGFVGTDMVGGARPGSITPDEAACCMIDSFEALKPEQNGCFLSRMGKIEPW